MNMNMNSKENQIVAQYSILHDKSLEMLDETKAKKTQIDQEINKIEAYNNIFLENQKDCDIYKIKKDTESIIRLAPILEPSFINDNSQQIPLPFQITNTSVNRLNEYEVILLATQSIKDNISMIDAHSFQNSICIGSDGLLRIYNILNGSIIFNWNIMVDSCQNNISCVTQISQNLICVGFEDGFVRMLDTNGIVVSEFPVSNEPISSIFYSTKNYLFVFAKNGEVSCWKGENVCIQVNNFKEPFYVFKDIEDASTNDVYIISQNYTKFRWNIHENTIVEDKNELSENKYLILNEANQIKIKIAPLNTEMFLTVDVPDYSCFDKSGSFFALSTGSKFFIYQINKIENDNQLIIRP